MIVFRSLPVLLTAAAIFAPAVLAQRGTPPRDGAGTSRSVERAPPAPAGQVIAPALSRRVSLDLRDVALEDALRTIEARAGIHLLYSRSVMPLSKRVSVRAEDVTAAEALRRVLAGTGFEAVSAGRDEVTLVRRASDREPRAEGVLTGRVTDATVNQPVANAQVIVIGAQRGALTDTGGRYTIAAVPPGAQQVRVLRLGYTPMTQTVTVADGQTVTLDFALTPAASRLEDVVVTVTGEQRRLEVGNVIGTIDADSVVREAPITSLSDLINARVPGVQVLQNNGLTGSSPRLRIRGVNSLTIDNSPLLVVDGVRVDNSAGGIGNVFGQASGRFNDLNPEELESIEVVKGPSAATLYGTDAANGVIVITTRRGRPGRAAWNVYAEAGITDQRADFPDNYRSWGTNTTTGAVQQCRLVQAAAGSCRIDSLTTFNPLRNGETTPLATGHRQQYGVQVSGGASQLTYFFSGEFEEETGALRMPDSERERISAERGGAAVPDEQVKPNALRRVSLRGNVGTTLGPTADVNLSLGLVSSDLRLVGSDIIQSASLGPGFRDAQDGWILGRPGEEFALRNVEEVTRFTGSLRGNWRPLAWLSMRGTVGLDHGSNFLDALQRRDEGPLSARIGQRWNFRTGVELYSVDLGASALFTPLERLSSRTSAGVQYNRTLLGRTGVIGVNLQPGMETVNAAGTLLGSETNSESIVTGGYVEQTFGFAEQIYVTGALRADGGSQFGRDFETAVYPKASASWLVADQRPGWLNSVRLRAAYGASGVQPGARDALALAQFSPVVIDGVSTPGASFVTLGNPDLKPERQTEFETGIDVELLDSRLRLEGTYYNKLSKDALIDVSLSPEVGIASRRENIGAVRNRGVEGLVSAVVIAHPVVSWDVTLNGSINRNRVEDLGLDGIDFLGAATYRHKEGYPIGSRFGPRIGSITDDGDGIVEAAEVQLEGDADTYLGTSHPTKQLTLGSSLSLFRGQLRIGTQFDYRGGHTIFNGAELVRDLIGNSRIVNDPTTSLEEKARIFTGNVSGYIEDASFTRWRELSFTYTLPEAIARRVRVRGASITVTGRNLALFSDYSGPDPELNDSIFFGAREGSADNALAVPQTRYWIVRLNLRF